MKKILFILALFFLSACENTSEKIKMNTDIEQLQRLISLQKTPSKAMWSIKEFGGDDGLGPNDWALVAIVEFEHDITKTLAKKTLKEDIKLPNMNWYPESFIKYLEKTDSGEYKTSLNKFHAESFFSSPLLNGYFIPIQETNSLFIYLYTM